MEEIAIKLNTIEAVKELVDTITPFKGAFDLAVGSDLVDAKSIMSICSMNLSRPIMLKIHEPNAEVMQRLEKFMIGQCVRNN